MPSNLQILKYVLLLFLGWLTALLIITYLGLSLLPNQDFYNKKLYYPNQNLQYFNRWSNWDGGGYRTIAESGYDTRLTVFFPAYPLLIKAITLTGLNSFWSAIFVSVTSAVVALFFLYKIALLDFDGQTAKKTLFALLVFPASFYLITVYNESLMLALAAGSFYFARKNNWPVSFLLAGLSALTRLTGLAVVVGVAFEYFFQNRKIFNFKVLWQSLTGRIFLYSLITTILLNTGMELYKKNQTVSGTIASILGISNPAFLAISALCLILSIKHLLQKISLNEILSKNFLYLLFSLLPFVSYLFYQQLVFGSPFTFLNSELLSWGRAISFPWQGPLYNLKYIIFQPFAIGEFSAHIHMQMAVFIFSLACLIFSYRNLRLSYTMYFFGALLIPLFSGMLADITRFSLVIFPIFLILSRIKNDIIQKTGVLFSALLLCLLTVLFFNNYFFI